MSAAQSPPPEPSGIAAALGLRVTEWRPGHCSVEVDVTPLHLNKGGAAHGGLLTTMLDMALGGALVASLKEEEWCATTQLVTSFLDAAKVGDRLVAEGRVVRRGRHVAHLAGQVRRGDRDVASASGTWAVWSSRPPSLELRRADALLERLVACQGQTLEGEGSWHFNGTCGTSELTVEVTESVDEAKQPIVDGAGALTLRETVFSAEGTVVHVDTSTYVRGEDGRLRLLFSTGEGTEKAVVEEGACSMRVGPVGEDGPTWRHGLDEEGRLSMDLWFSGSAQGGRPDIAWAYRWPNS